MQITKYFPVFSDSFLLLCRLLSQTGRPVATSVSVFWRQAFCCAGKFVLLLPDKNLKRSIKH